MAAHALQPLQLGRLQVQAVPLRGCDLLPLRRVRIHVTGNTARVGHLGVRRDLARPVRYPEHKLAGAGEDRLLVALVAAQLGVPGGLELLPRRRHHVAAAAEVVVVLHVVPAAHAEPARHGHHDRRHGTARQQMAPRPVGEPRQQLGPLPPRDRHQPQEQEDAHDRPGDLQRLRRVEDAAYDVGNSAGKRWLSERNAVAGEPAYARGHAPGRGSLQQEQGRKEPKRTAAPAPAGTGGERPASPLPTSAHQCGYVRMMLVRTTPGVAVTP